VRLSDDAQSALLGYAWPANIRELENVIHYALIACRDGVVRATDFRFSPLAVLREVAASPGLRNLPPWTRRFPARLRRLPGSRRSIY